MPGVTVRTETRSGPLTPPIPAAGRYFVAGLTERGRTDAAIRVRSIAELEAYTGKRQAYGAVYDDVRTYFEEGGAEAYVCRVVGTGATLGTFTLVDRATTPLNTLRIDALGAGSWSTRVEVQVLDGGAVNTFTIRVYFDAVLVESFADLDSPAAAAGALLESNYIRGTDLGAATVAPNNNPAVRARTALSAGNDQRSTVTAAMVTAALDNLAVSSLGTGAVATPGYAAGSVATALIAHARARRRIALLAGGPADDIAATTTLAASLDGTGNGEEHATLLYPWIRVPITGIITKTISPEGYAAAARARAIMASGGPWHPPAGRIAEARFVLGLVRELTRADADTLDAAHVSAIRTIAGTTRLYGWRSLSTDEQNYALLSGRDVINAVAFEAELALEDYVFRPIDGSGGLLSEVEAELVGILEPIRVAGGIYPRRDEDTGDELDPGYSVDVGPSVNTQAVIAGDELRAVIALRVSPVATDLVVTIVKAGLTASV